MQTVLVVEDDRTTRHLIRGLLEKDGFLGTSPVTDARRSTQLDQHEFDLLMIDVWMPGMDGIRAAGPAACGATAPAHRRDHRRRHACDDPAADRARAGLPRHPQAGSRADAARDRAHRARRAVRSRARIEVVPGDASTGSSCWCRARSRPPNASSPSSASSDADLPAGVRETVGQAFNELLRNAIEWGGELDPTRMVRDLPYARPARALLSHRRSREGFSARPARALRGGEPGRSSVRSACRFARSWAFAPAGSAS